MNEHDDAEKPRSLETAASATFVCYDASASGSGSNHVRGPVSRWEVDEATLNELFPPFCRFDEAVADLEFVLYALEMDAVVGRRTVE